MARRLGGAVLVAAVLAGCGSDKPAAEPAKPPAKPTPAAFDPGTLLMRDGEEPGFHTAASPNTDTQPFPMGPAGTKALTQSGFVSSTYQPIETKGAAGASSITLFKTSAGAKAWFEHETTDAGIKEQIPHPGKIRRFTIPGVPGARAWSGLDMHGNEIGQVYWADGRCEFVLGNEGNPPFVKPMRAGAKAWYERTRGKCST